jgi:hypothetical protein
MNYMVHYRTEKRVEKLLKEAQRQEGDLIGWMTGRFGHIVHFRTDAKPLPFVKCESAWAISNGPTTS